MTRKTTNQLLEMIEDGLLDRDVVITACLKYMSEDDVADMCHANDFLPDEWDEDTVEDEDDDDDNDGGPPFDAATATGMYDRDF